MGERVRGSWKAAGLLAVGIAGGAAAVAVATVPDSSGVIHACYALSPAGGTLPATGGPNLRIIDTDAGQSCNTVAGMGTLERPISWNVTGPQGPPGRNGVQGPPGKPGTATFTYTLVPPQVRVTAPPEGGVVLDTGRTPIKFQFLSFSFAASGGAAGGQGTGSGKSGSHLVSITKAQDKATPQLMKLGLHGESIKQATITEVKKSGEKQPYVQFTLNTVLVTSFQVGSSKGGQRPEETLTLSYAKISEKYFK